MTLLLGTTFFKLSYRQNKEYKLQQTELTLQYLQRTGRLSLDLGIALWYMQEGET